MANNPNSPSETEPELGRLEYEDPARPILPPIATEPKELPKPEQASEAPISKPPQAPPPIDQAPLADSAPATPNLATRHRTPWLRVGFALVVVGIAICTGIFLATFTGSRQDQTWANAEAAQLQKLSAKNGQITDASVKHFNKTDLFFAVFRRASEEQVVHAKTSQYVSSDPNAQATNQTIRDLTLNYTTKQFSQSLDTYIDNATTPSNQYRCVAGKEYVFSPGDSNAGWSQRTDGKDCQWAQIKLYANDGLNTGGLNDSQANHFVGALRKHDKFINIRSLQSVRVNGKNYLKFTVAIEPVKIDGDYQGLQLFMAAFKRTGLNPDEQPYNYIGASNQGANISYYVDAKTQLPAYAQITTTAMVGPTGQAQKGQSYTHQWVEYGFSENVASPTLKDHQPIQFSWAGEKM